jgi:hypothetical protein
VELPPRPDQAKQRRASISGTGAGTAALCAHVHPIQPRKHSNGRIRSTADSGTRSMPASRQAPLIHVHNFHPPDYPSVTGIGNWVTAVTLRGKCRTRAPPGSQRTQWGTALRNAQAVQPHYRCNPAQLVCHPSVIASLQTSFNGKGRTKAAYVSVHSEPTAHPHAVTMAWRHNKLLAP